MVKFNYSGIGKNQPPQTLVDPVDIFRSSTVIDQNVNDLWLGQGDALREWHREGHLDDIGVVLNTVRWKDSCWSVDRTIFG